MDVSPSKWRRVRVADNLFNIELGKRIRQYRKAKNVTQEKLALLAGIDRAYIGLVERGEQNIGFCNLCQICVALECDVATLTVGIPRLPGMVG